MLEGYVDVLEDRLAVRKLVDRAKGRLMDEKRMTEAEAFSFIQQTAMAHRRTMADVANEVLAG